MTQGTLFRCGSTGLLRAPVLPVDTPASLAGSAEPATDPSGPVPGVSTAADADSRPGQASTAWRIAADPLVREAVETASPSLGAVVRHLAGGSATPPMPSPKELRRASRALTSYLLRMSARATPFGLMAGVAAVECGGDATVHARLGSRHRRRVRPDRGWLAEVVSGLERRPDVLPHLRLVANDQARIRDGRLALPATPRRAAGSDLDAVHEVTVRYTVAVRAAVELAAEPVRGADLARRLQRRLPDAPEGAVARLMSQLVEQGVLLTDAQPSVASDDPLAEVCAVLAELPCPADVLPERAALGDLRTALEACEAAPLGAGRRLLATARTHMAGICPGNRSLQTDLVLDADVRLPRRVTEEAERAAHMLWRLAPRPEGSSALRAYHSAFLGRYGTDRLVPVAELIDPDTGLGPLDDYRTAPTAPEVAGTGAAPAGKPPTQTEPPAAPVSRDTVLAALAQEALLDGAAEVLLTDDHPTVAALAADDGTPPPSLDLCAQLLARHPDDLATGDFRLVLTGAAPQAAAMMGRFAGLLPAAHRERLAAVAGAAAASCPGGSRAAVQLTGPAGRSRAANIAHAPRWLPRTLPIGAFADGVGKPAESGPTGPHGTSGGALSVDGLVVGADHRRLWLREADSGRVVSPVAFHVLNPASPELPPAARFLRELSGSGVRAWKSWDWGTAAALPWLPRVRYGNTVLAPARWLPTDELRDQQVPFADWCAAFAGWRERWRVPRTVRVGHGDRHIEVSCDRPEQLLVLRHELGRDRSAVLQEAPTEAGCPDGWLAGPGERPHRAEIVLPLLRATGEAAPPPPHQGAVAAECPAPATDAGDISAPYAREEPPARVAGRQPSRTVTQRAHLPGGRWVSAVLYCRPERQNDILVGHLPQLLQQLPPTVDRWFFVRYQDEAGPHLRLRLHTADAAESRAQVLPLVHDFADTVLAAGLGQRMVLDTYRPETERYGGPDALAAAERAFHADSLAVLAQLAPVHAGRVTLDPAVLSAANQVACARAFHTATDSATDSAAPPGGPLGGLLPNAQADAGTGEPNRYGWWPVADPRDPETDRYIRAHRAIVLDVTDPEHPAATAPLHALGLPPGPAADWLSTTWERRADALAVLGHTLRGLGQQATAPPSSVLLSVLHMLHNRLIGPGPDIERTAHALVAGGLRAHRGRARHAAPAHPPAAADGTGRAQ